MTAVPTNNDATRDRADAEQPPRAGGTTRYRLPPNCRDVTATHVDRLIVIVGAPRSS
jgi:hypothetical protein